MSLLLKNITLKKTNSRELIHYRDDKGLYSNRSDDHLHHVNEESFDETVMCDLLQAAEKTDDRKVCRAIESILEARNGNFSKSVPNFMAFCGMARAYLRHGLIDGWIYSQGSDGYLYPELVVGLRSTDPTREDPCVSIHTEHYSPGGSGDRMGNNQTTYSFVPSSVTKKRLKDIFSEAGLSHETAELKESYMRSMERYTEKILPSFSRQFFFEGIPYLSGRSSRRSFRQKEYFLSRRKVIHNLDSGDYSLSVKETHSSIIGDPADNGTGVIPKKPLVEVFDLSSYTYFWSHSDSLSEYKYDLSLREKIILPESHRDLLDILTTNLDQFLNDVIDGKSSGNVILCKGIPGVGKTLTAEIYSELMERPLYMIHSGKLGVTASSVSENLRRIFEETKRWGCVLLLDEADVFVVKRGNSIEQNAIVAEFLKILEYFDGLLFMTTNRPNDIDDAIVSRCAAIIDYHPPGEDHCTRIWNIMSRQFGVPLDPVLVSDLVKLFPGIVPRDIKMLFRLAVKMSVGHKEPLTIDVFRRCAMFRAIEMMEK